MSEPSFDFGGEIVWRPTPELIAQSRLKQFMDEQGLTSFDELWQRSTTDLDWLWNAVLRSLDIQFYTPYSQVVDLSKGSAPSEIKFVKNLPKTRNAKVMRRISRAAYLGQDPGDTSSNSQYENN